MVQRGNHYQVVVSSVVLIKITIISPCYKDTGSIGGKTRIHGGFCS